MNAAVNIPWNVHPNPQFRRENYVNLNGEWEFSLCKTEKISTIFDKRIMVPFCPESRLSGLEMEVPPGSYLYYARDLEIPANWQGGRVLLHIGAADQITKVYVNQKEVGGHIGGYNRFTVDITDALEEKNRLVIRVFDDLRDKTLPWGKQSLKPGGMWYTPVSGIWQTVWMEWVPREYIRDMHIVTNREAAVITVTPAMDGQVLCQGKAYPLVKGKAEITPDNPQLWSPEHPWLYPVTVIAGEDRVESYFALRTLEIRQVGDYVRLCLNGQPVFFHGLLDQGYWPDGIYTPQSPEQMEQEILKMKALGFNTLRKHIKIEPEHYYYLCDKHGMFVFQDMVNNGQYRYFWDTVLPTFGLQKRRDAASHKNKLSRQAFFRAMEETVGQLKNHPSIVYWTIFNEGWGQFCSQEAYEKMKQLDSSRFIGSTSGWFRGADSDVESHHLYYTWVTKWEHLKAGKKPLVLTEFGGYVHPVENHMFRPDKVYGYKICQTREELNRDLQELYEKRIVPLAKKGLCAAIYTQVSDVEEEMNGLLTYDRQVCKVDEDWMQSLSAQLQEAVKG